MKILFLSSTWISEIKSFIRAAKCIKFSIRLWREYIPWKLTIEIRSKYETSTKLFRRWNSFRCSRWSFGNRTQSQFSLKILTNSDELIPPCIQQRNGCSTRHDLNRALPIYSVAMSETAQTRRLIDPVSNQPHSTLRSCRYDVSSVFKILLL